MTVTAQFELRSGQVEGPGMRPAKCIGSGQPEVPKYLHKKDHEWDCEVG
jgi:hypothetical protein